MRARNLKPSFFKNEELATLPGLNRILFQGLWCLADKEGRLEDRPLRIKAEALPYDSCDVDQMLDALAKFPEPFIIRYSIGEKAYIQVVTAGDHFNPHPNEKDSEIPPFSSGVVKKYEALAKCNKALLAIIPESPLIESPLIESPNMSEPQKSAAADLPSLKSLFEKIWAQYPKRDGKKAAERHFRVSIKTTQDWLDIQRALANYLRSEKVRKGYIKNGSTWFNNWQDWINYTEEPHAQHGGAGIHHDDPFRARVREVKGLRKANFEGAAGALLDSIRTGSLPEKPSEESVGPGRDKDGDPVA